MKKRLLVFVSTAILASSLMAFAQVYVHIGPPPPAPREIVPAPMHRGWVWQAGYYRWDGRRYVWIPGHYAAPPRGYARWIPGHWRNSHRGYVWVPGHWS